MKVTAPKTLAAAQKWARRNKLTKPQIKTMLEQGEFVPKVFYNALHAWCGVLTPAKRATVKPSVKKNPYIENAKKVAPAKKVAENNQQKKHGGKRPNSGGARKGSGRKVGSATTRTRAIADKLMESDEQSPLEYLLEVMRSTPAKIKAAYEKGDLDVTEYTVALQDLTRRRDKAAADAASYCHPRLSSIDASVGLKGHDLFVALMAEEDK